jgi:hypothetical protein
MPYLVENTLDRIIYIGQGKYIRCNNAQDIRRDIVVNIANVNTAFKIRFYLCAVSAKVSIVLFR